MKLRYYLRGLGIGIFVTALLMGVALKDNRSLTDAEIRARATELGMVEENSRTLADIQDSQEPGLPSPNPSAPVGTPEETPEPTSTSTSEPSAESIPETTPTSAATPTPAETSTPETTPDPAEATPLKPLPMVTPKPSPTASPDPVVLPVPELTPPTTTPESVSFVISSGQSSYTVSKALAEVGLVEDASVFDQYLEENGYSKSIHPGNYEIPLGSTQEEIAGIIAGSR